MEYAKGRSKESWYLDKVKKSIVKWDGKSCNCLIVNRYFFIRLYYSLTFAFFFLLVLTVGLT